MKNIYFSFLLTIFSFSLLSSCKNADNELSESQKRNATELNSMKELLLTHKDSTGLRFKIAILEDSLSQYDNALAQIDTILQTDSANYGMIFTKGHLYQEKKDTAKAIQYFEKSLRIYPAPEGLLNLASLYAEQHNPKALETLQKVTSLEMGRQSESNIQFITGVYYARINDTAKALAAFNQCLTLDYSKMPAYIEKGLIYFDRKMYAQALATFEMASSVNKMYPDAYYYQGRVYEMTNKKDSAINKFQEALSIDKNFVEANAAIKRLQAK